MTLDVKLVMYAIWGLGVVVLYGRVLWGRRRLWKARHTARARRDLIVAFSLFLTALAASAAIFAVLFGPLGTGVRGFFVAVALGAFFAAGLVMGTGSEDKP
jgi:hypothetical protein